MRYRFNAAQRPRVVLCAAPVLLALFLASGPAMAQDDNETVGFQTKHIFDGSQFDEHIDLLNGSLTFTIPIGPQMQLNRNLGYQLMLAYGSKMWDSGVDYYESEAGLYRRNPMGLGFGMHFGRIFHDVEVRPDNTGNPAYYCDWYFVTPDGSEHILPGDNFDPRSCANYPTQPYTVDNTFYSIGGGFSIPGWNGSAATAPTFIVTTPDGIILTLAHYVSVKGSNGLEMNKDNIAGGYGLSDVNREYNRDFGGWYVTRVEDSRSTYQVVNGTNIHDVRLDIAYDTHPGFEHVIKTITETVGGVTGRVVTFDNSCVPPASGSTPSGCDEVAITSEPQKNRYSVRTDAIHFPKFTGQPAIDNSAAGQAVYNFNYTYNRGITNLGNTTHVETASQLDSIDYPVFSTHQGTSSTRYRMSFLYDSYGELYSRTLPTGAISTYYYDNYFYFAGGIYGLNTSGSTRHVSMRTLALSTGETNPATWRYVRQANDYGGTGFSNPRYVTVTDPFLNDTVYYFRASQPNPTALSRSWDTEDGWSPEWNDGANYQIEYYQGSGASRKLVRSEIRDFDADLRCCSGHHDSRNIRVTRQAIVYHDDGGRQSQVSYRDWDGLGHFRVVSETGDEIDGTRITRTEYAGRDSGRFTLREVSDGKRVLSRTEKDFGGGGGATAADIVVAIQRATLPATLGSGSTVPLTAAPGDVVTLLSYDGSSNIIKTEIGDQGLSYDSVARTYSLTNPKYRVQYTWQAGKVATKEFYDWTFAQYFPWKAVDRSRDGNTGLVFASRDTAGVPTTYSYDALGRVTDIASPAPEFPIQIEYTDVRHTSVRQGDPAVMGSNYACSSGAGDYLMTCYEYDTFGRLSKAQKRPYDPSLGYPYQTISYDIAGRKTFESEWLWPGQNPCAPDPLDKCGTTYEYAASGSSGVDPFGRVRRVTTADKQVTETNYFGLSSTVTVKGIRGADGTPFDASTTYYRDDWNRLLYVQTPKAPAGSTNASLKGGSDAQYFYDLRDNLIRVELIDSPTGQRQIRRFDYDPLNRLRLSVNPESGTEAITAFDPIGNVLEKRNATGDRFSTVYDGAGRVTQNSLKPYQKPGQPPTTESVLETFQYDGTGTTTCPTGVPGGAYGCSNGKPIVTTDYGDSGAFVRQRTLSYFGLNGRLSSENQLFGDYTGAEVRMTYNNLGLTSRTDYPEGPSGKGGLFALTNTYSNGYITEVWDPQVTYQPQARAKYNAAGGFQDIVTYGSVRSLINPDARNRPKDITIGQWSGTAFTRTDYQSGAYQYDGAGNIFAIGGSTYGYDAANRLVSATDLLYGDTSNTYKRTQTFGYDDYGNMTSKLTKDGAGVTIGNDTFTLNDQTSETSDPATETNINQIRRFRQIDNVERPQFYDARGNQIVRNLQAGTQVYDYDSRNRMTVLRGIAAGELARYSYDNDANRIVKDDKTAGLRTYFVRSMDGRLLSEFRRANNQFSSAAEWSKHYLYLGGRLLGLRENGIPQPPGGLTATATSGGVVTLTWNANPTGNGVTVPSYKVYRTLATGTVGSTWLLLGNPTTPAWTDSATTLSTDYWYAVTAVDSGGRESYASAPVELYTGDTTKPLPPTSVTAVAGDQMVTLTWVPSTMFVDVMGFNVYRGNTKLNSTLVTGTTYTDLGLSNGNTYTYTVKAKDPIYESDPSTPVSATPNRYDYVPPAPPVGVIAAGDCNGTPSITVSWQANLKLDGVSRYLVYRSPAFTDQTGLPPGARNALLATTYTDNETTSGMTYAYTVVAEDAATNASVASQPTIAVARYPTGTVPTPDPPAAQAGDAVVSLRIPVPTNWSGISAFKVYKKLNVNGSCDNYELLSTITSAPSGGYVDLTDAVPNNLAYDYAVTRVDSSNRESAMSRSALAIPVGISYGYSECAQDLGATPYYGPVEGAFSCGSKKVCMQSHASCNYPTDCPIVGETCSKICSISKAACTVDSECPSGQYCNYASWYMRRVVRWNRPVARPYQPYSATFADGSLGYVKGFHPYLYETTSTLLNGYDSSTFTAQQPNYEYRYCTNHPDIMCGFCPDTGETCSNSYSSSLMGAGSCLGGTFGGSVCYQDSECPGGRCNLANSLVDPFLIKYSDLRWYAGYRGYDGNDCLTNRAVYKVLANGVWVTVESNPSDDFDVTEKVDPTNRCIEPDDLYDLCLARFVPYEYYPHTQACPLPSQLPPTPTGVTATPSASEQGTITVSWQAPPPGHCALQDLIGCEGSIPCAGAGQICQECPYGPTGCQGLSGWCVLNNPATCTDPGGACPTAGQYCKSDEVVGYNVYAVELDTNKYHFLSPAPYVAADNSQPSYDFKGLGQYVTGTTPNKFYFRVATVDSGGRVSEPSTPTATVTPVARVGGNAIPAPMSLKNSINGTSWSLVWKAGGTYTRLSGYVIYRSKFKEGPFCAMLQLGTGNPAGVPICSNEITGTPGIPGAASTSITSTGTSFSDSTIPLNTAYYYRATAVTSGTGGGESVPSDIVAGGSIPAPSNKLRRPEQFKAWAAQWRYSGEQFYRYERGVYLRWCGDPASVNPGYQALTGYKVYRSSTPKGPYTPLLATPLPLNCLDGHTRCEIQCPSGVNPPCTLTSPSNFVLATTTSCVTGVDGTCKVVDMTVGYPTGNYTNDVANFIYYYTVTSVKGTDESGYSDENQGWPNYCSGTTCTQRYDPDNPADIPCGGVITNSPLSRLELQEDSPAPAAVLAARQDPLAMAMDLPDADPSTTTIVIHLSSLDLSAPEPPALTTLPLPEPAPGGHAHLNPDRPMAPYRIIGSGPRAGPGAGSGSGSGAGSGPGPGGSLPLPTPNGSPRYVYYHLDHLGSPRVIADAGGQAISTHRYLPFGEETPTPAMNTTSTRQFTGHERDTETGLDYMLARYYSASLDRFLSFDPAASSLHPADPQSWDRYTYGANNPLRYIDLNGRFYWQFHQSETAHVLSQYSFWSPGDVKAIAERTGTLDHGRTNAVIDPKQHFGGSDAINHWVALATEAYARGDRALGNEYTARAMHLAFDSDGGAHSDTNYLDHGIRKGLGWVQEHLLGHHNTLDPDSKYSRGWLERYLQGLSNMHRVAQAVSTGTSYQPSKEGLPPGVPFVLEVDMRGASYYEVLTVADKYADKGYAVYIDGACYRNC